MCIKSRIGPSSPIDAVIRPNTQIIPGTIHQLASGINCARIAGYDLSGAPHFGRSPVRICSDFDFIHGLIDIERIKKCPVNCRVGLENCICHRLRAKVDIKNHRHIIAASCRAGADQSAVEIIILTALGVECYGEIGSSSITEHRINIEIAILIELSGYIGNPVTVRITIQIGAGQCR